VQPLPPGLAYTKIAAGGGHAVALRSDGSLAAWGFNADGECDVPALRPERPMSWRREAGRTRSLRSDGAVLAWEKQLRPVQRAGVPSDAELVQLAAGLYHLVALLSDGTIVTWGQDIGAVPGLSGRQLRRGRLGSSVQRRAPQRRIGRGLGRVQLLRPMERACAASGPHLRRGRGRTRPRTRAPQRRLGGRVGVEQLGSMRRSGASRGSHVRRDRSRLRAQRRAAQRRFGRQLGEHGFQRPQRHSAARGRHLRPRLRG
jgi:alpha-tubulin suppressor-like RCC1 family protein